MTTAVADPRALAASGGVNWVTRARLISGVVLYVYVTTHFLNHALGFLSLEAMEQGRQVFLGVWRTAPGTAILYLSMITHVMLVLWSLYRRRSLIMPPREMVQIICGLLIPPALSLHIIGTRLAFVVFDLNDLYIYVLANYWMFDPLLGISMVVTLLLAWTHGSLGMYYWLRLKSWFPAVAPWIYPVVLLLPVLALAGFANAGRETMALFEAEGFGGEFASLVNIPDDPAAAEAYLYGFWYRWLSGYAVVLLLVFAGRLIRHARTDRSTQVTLTYPDGRKVTVAAGTTILEASRMAGVPHASVCGGRGRCSTCRVKVGIGAEHLPMPNADEQRVLFRVGTAAKGIRLACQVRPTHDLSVTPLLAADAQPKDAFAKASFHSGAEREIAILFADIRSFTEFSETKLPYDVVFVLNQYFRTMGSAVEAAGGRLDKFIGDGVMALFGVESDPAQGAADALVAARQMAQGLNEINANLKNDLPQPLRMGIGIHIGHVIVGDMGYAQVRSITAIGDAVNTASRLEALNKEHRSQLIVSRDVVTRAGADFSGITQKTVDVRGRAEPLDVYILDDATKVPVAEKVLA